MSDSPYSVRWPGKGRSGSVSKPNRKDDMDSAVDDESLMAKLANSEQASFAFQNEDEQSLIRGTCITAVNGVELITDPQGVAYWPAEETLLVADLHLEKGSSFARRGQLLPPYDTEITLKRLTACVEKWHPKRVIALGDSFHDEHASYRLSDTSRSTLESLMNGREWVWITGNHDPQPPQGLGGEVLETLDLGGLHLRHEPQVDSNPGEIAGHLHPKARLLRKGRSVRRSCFATDHTRMIMPSFGAYTGGLSVFHPAFEGLFEGRKFHALMRGEDQVYRIAASDLSR